MHGEERCTSGFSTRLRVSLSTVAACRGSVGLRHYLAGRRRCQSAGSLPWAVGQCWGLRQEEERVRREDRDAGCKVWCSWACHLLAGLGRFVAATLPSAVGWWCSTRWRTNGDGCARVRRGSTSCTCSGPSTSGPPVDMVGMTDPAVCQECEKVVTVTKRRHTRKTFATPFFQLEAASWLKQTFVAHTGVPSCTGRPFRMFGKNGCSPQYRRRLVTSFPGGGRCLCQGPLSRVRKPGGGRRSKHRTAHVAGRNRVKPPSWS